MIPSSPRCAACGRELPSTLDVRFCPFCGAPVNSTTPPTSTVLFASPVGATPEGAPALQRDVVDVPGWISQARDRTKTGLVLVMIGIGIGWIPYASYVGGFLVFIGLILLYLGRWGFGPDHRRFVLAGIVIVLLGILIAFFGALLFASTIVSAGTMGLTPSQLTSALQSDVVGLFIVVFIAGAIGAVGQAILPQGLADTKTRRILWIAAGLAIVVSGFVLWIITPEVSSAVGQAVNGTSMTVNTGPITALESQEYVLELLSIGPDALFVWGYYRVWSEAVRRTPLVGTA
jgi:hypothetical protein